MTKRRPVRPALWLRLGRTESEVQTTTRKRMTEQRKWKTITENEQWKNMIFSKTQNVRRTGPHWKTRRRSSSKNSSRSSSRRRILNPSLHHKKFHAHSTARHETRRNTEHDLPICQRHSRNLWYVETILSFKRSSEESADLDHLEWWHKTTHDQNDSCPGFNNSTQH